MAKKKRVSKGREKKSTKRLRKRAARTPAKRLAKIAKEQRRVTGTVLKIVQGQLTNERISAEEAFTDAQQAVEQVLYAERHATGEKLKLVRLAYRQYQRKRFRAK